jgi:hypothetical protein
MSKGPGSPDKGLFLPQFLIPGNPASWSPVKSFAQGLADEPPNREFSIEGFRCSKCGFLELFVTESTI